MVNYCSSKTTTASHLSTECPISEFGVMKPRRRFIKLLQTRPGFWYDSGFWLVGLRIQMGEAHLELRRLAHFTFST